WDLGAVWVLDPATGRYLKADAVDPALRGMTEYQWRVLKRAVRERFDQPEHVRTLAEGRNAIRDVVEKEAKKPSRKRRARAARFLGRPKAQGEEVPLPADGPWTDVTLSAAPQPTPTVPPADGPPPAPPPRRP